MSPTPEMPPTRQVRSKVPAENKNGTPGTKRIAAAILEVLGGIRLPSDASTALGFTRRKRTVRGATGDRDVEVRLFPPASPCPAHAAHGRSVGATTAQAWTQGYAKAEHSNGTCIAGGGHVKIRRVRRNRRVSRWRLQSASQPDKR